MRKLLFICLIVLFTLTLLPNSASAVHTTDYGIDNGTLIKKAGSDSVYYYTSGKRFVFPNQKTYNTWYSGFDSVVTISSETLGEIPIGGNVTYKPGKKMVKITSSPKVYYVTEGGTLRHVATVSIAIELFGTNWESYIEDVPDPFFVNYQVGKPLSSAEKVSLSSGYSIGNDKGLTSSPDPIASEGTIELIGNVTGNRADLSWFVNGFTSEKGFKLIISENPNPVYPGNEYHYLSDPNQQTDTWPSLTNGTYHFRVCEYLGGSCGVYSNDLELTITEGIDESDKAITLTGIIDVNTVNLSWDGNFTSAKGYKVVRSSEINPVYPGNEYHYLSDPNDDSDIWTLSTGTHYFRVCEYLGGSCGTYSNNLEITITAEPAEDSNGSINLTGYYDSANGKVYLNWTVNDMTCPKGFKIVKDTSANPVYPGNDYHYKSSPDTRSDYWAGLGSGTYNFRVCEYLGGACGIYSNNLVVTVP